jgi:BED zinc finger
MLYCHLIELLIIDCLPYSMGLDPNYASDEIQRIIIDAPIAETQDIGAVATVPQDQVPEHTRKRKTREKMTSDAWKYFKKIPTGPDEFYDATCIYCGKVYQMGNSRSIGSLKHRAEKGCKKLPSLKKHKPGALQRLLQTGNTSGTILLIFSFNFDGTYAS